MRFLTIIPFLFSFYFKRKHDIWVVFSINYEYTISLLRISGQEALENAVSGRPTECLSSLSTVCEEILYVDKTNSGLLNFDEPNFLIFITRHSNNVFCYLVKLFFLASLVFYDFFPILKLRHKA